VLAAHCPRGQIYRVSMERCVSKTSRLARDFVGVTRINKTPARAQVIFPILRPEPDYHAVTPIPVGRGETPRISPQPARP
jgi:hypothetical protein